MRFVGQRSFQAGESERLSGGGGVDVRFEVQILGVGFCDYSHI